MKCSKQDWVEDCRNALQEIARRTSGDIYRGDRFASLIRISTEDAKTMAMVLEDALLRIRLTDKENSHAA